MKQIVRLCLLLFAGLAVGCSQTGFENDYANDKSAMSDFRITATPTDVLNEYIFTTNYPSTLTSWDLGNGKKEHTYGAVKTGYGLAGTYVVQAKTLSAKGLVTASLTIEITTDNPDFTDDLSDEIKKVLTDGAVWMLDVTKPGFYYGGAADLLPEDPNNPQGTWWYQTTDNTDAEFVASESSFAADGSYGLDNKGITYTSGQAEAARLGDDYESKNPTDPNADWIVHDFTPPADWSFKVEKRGMQYFLVFGESTAKAGVSGFMSYYDGTSEYEIYRYKADEIYLRVQLSWGSRFFRYVPKSVIPTQESKLDEIKALLTGTDGRSWKLDGKQDGFYAVGAVNFKPAADPFNPSSGGGDWSWVAKSSEKPAEFSASRSHFAVDGGYSITPGAAIYCGSEVEAQLLSSDVEKDPTGDDWLAKGFVSPSDWTWSLTQQGDSYLLSFTQSQSGIPGFMSFFDGECVYEILGYDAQAGKIALWANRGWGARYFIYVIAN